MDASDTLEVERLTAGRALDELMADDASAPRFVFVGQVGTPKPPAAERLFVRAATGGEPALADPYVLWVLSEELPALVSGLAARVGARVGGCDAMFAVGGARCWAPRGAGGKALGEAQTPLDRWPDAATRAPFVLFESGRLACSAGPEGLLLAGRQAIAKADVERVEFTISDTWCDREVAAVLRDGTRVAVAAESTSTPLLGSMVYDGFDLLMDTGWGYELVRGLGEALGVPIRVPDP